MPLPINAHESPIPNLPLLAGIISLARKSPLLNLSHQSAASEELKHASDGDGHARQHFLRALDVVHDGDEDIRGK